MAGNSIWLTRRQEGARVKRLGAFNWKEIESLEQNQIFKPQYL